MTNQTSQFATALPTPKVGRVSSPPTRRHGLDILYIKPGQAIPSERTIKAVEVTPTLAQDWLDRYSDPRKRSTRPAKVADYGEQMKAGQWLDQSAHALDFTNGTDARLSDGHHRLKAIVASGVTVWMQVNFASDPRSRHVEGVRVTRTASDMLRMEGCAKHQAAISSAVKVVLMYDQTAGTRNRWNRIGGVTMPDNEDIVLSWLEDQAIWDRIATITIAHATAFPHGFSPQAIEAATLVIERKYPGEGIAFLTECRMGRGPIDGYGMTVIACIETIRRSGAIKTTGGGSREEWARAVMAVMIRAFNAWKAGKPSFSRPEIGSLVKPFPLDKVA